MELYFAVQDAGIGRTPKGMVKRLQSFAQADSSTRRKYGRTGLGLVISRKLAEFMGGTMSAESDGAGKGRSFRFRVVAEAMAAPAAAARPTGKAAIDRGMDDDVTKPIRVEALVAALQATSERSDA